MTSRELNERVGGFRERDGEVFWLEDAAYIEDIERIGCGAAVLADLERAPHGRLPTTPRRRARRTSTGGATGPSGHGRERASKRALVRVPFVRRFNARFSWFVVPLLPRTRPDLNVGIGTFRRVG